RVALVLLLALGPWALWIARNISVHRHFIPFSTDGAWVFFMGQVYHPDEAYTVGDPEAMRRVTETPVEYDWYKQMNQEGWAAVRAHPLRSVYWGLMKIRQTFHEFAAGGLGWLYPVFWIGLPLYAFRTQPWRRAA